jgi:hypothetical protein
LKYTVKYPFRDRDGIERKRGDIMEINDPARALKLQQKGLIGKAHKEPERPEPEKIEPEKPAETPDTEPETRPKRKKPPKGGDEDET